MTRLRKIKNSAKNISYKTWEFGTVNIRSGKEKLEGARMYMVAKEIERQNLLFCAIQEVKHRNAGDKMIHLDTGTKYRFIWCGKKKRRDAGVGILVKQDPKVIISDPDFSDPRIMALNMNVYGFKIRVVIGYSPTNVEKSIYAKDIFYKNLRKVCAKDEPQRKLIVLGDFNAETDIVLKKSDFDGTFAVEDKLCNDNGERLKSHCRKFKLCMSQSYFAHPLEERHTWYSSDGKTKKVIDYVMVENFVQQFITDCKVIQDDKLESDHRLLVASVRTPTNKATRWSPRVKKPESLNINALNEPDTRQSFMNRTAEKINWKENQLSTTQLSEKLVESIQTAAQETIPRKQRTESKHIWKSDEELNSLLDNRSMHARQSERFKYLTTLIKKRIRKLRNDKLKQEAAELDEFATTKKLEAMYKSFKHESNGFRDTRTEAKCDEQKLKEFFTEHFALKTQSEIPKELKFPPRFQQQIVSDTSNQLNFDPPGRDEIAKILKKLKAGKAASDIPPSFIKCAADSNEVMSEIVKLYRLVWETKEVPEKWGMSKLVAIWKGTSKGKATDPKAYRALQIGSTLCKILVLIILERLRKWYDDNLLDQQQGFRPNRGTTDGIFLVKRLQQIANKTTQPIYAIFVDLTAAFDHVNRDWLFQSIKQRFPGNQSNILFELLEKLYSKTQTTITGNMDESFEIFVGVRQGGPESPFLYNLYMDYVLRVFILECEKTGVDFVKLEYLVPADALKIKRQLNLGLHGKMTVDWIGYADDLVIAFRDQNSLQRGLDILNETFNRYQLTINASKTKTMILSFDGDEYPRSISQLNGEPIENVECFRYLGAQIHHTEHSTGDTEINFRIDSAESKFYQHGKKFMNKRISLKTRVQIFNSLVRSRLTYGCQAWTLTSRHEHQLNAVYIRMLRMMIRRGFKRKEDSWAFVLTNVDVCALCKTDPLTNFIHQQQERYVTKIVRSKDEGLIKRITFNNDAAHRRGPTNDLLKSVIAKTNAPATVFYKRVLRDEMAE